MFGAWERAWSTQMAVDIREVAEKARVSISTVSRVLNKSGYVSDATRSKVLHAADDLGYRQNSIARSLRSKKSSFIGLLVPDVANEFFASLARSIEQFLHNAGYSLFLCNTMESPEEENRYIESLLDHQVMGIVLVSAGLKRHPRVQREKTPIVFVDRVGADIDLPYRVIIESDNEKGGALAAEALFQRGVERFMFLGDERSMHHMREREHGFFEALRARGVPKARIAKTAVSVSSGNAREKVKEVRAKFPFDGLFCGTDTIAIGALRGIQDMGFQVPSDVQVIGFDGISLGGFFSPSLSTIRQDTERMGKLAADSIVRMIAGDRNGETIILPVEFLARGSTR